MSERQLVDRVKSRLDTRALGWTVPSGRKPVIHLAVPREVREQIRLEWEDAQRRGLTWKQFATEWAHRMAPAPPSKSLQEAVADGDFMACPACFTIQRTAQQQRATCVFCGQSFPRNEGVDLARAGFDVAYHGWYYGAAHAAEARRRRRRRRAFKLPEPCPFLWALGVFIAMAIAQGLTWDSIKVVARRLNSRYRRWRTRSALLTDAEAVQNLRTLHQWADDYLRDETRTLTLKQVRVTKVRVGGRRILEVSVRTEAPKRRKRKTPPTTGRQAKQRRPRKRSTRRGRR